MHKLQYSTWWMACIHSVEISRHHGLYGSTSCCISHGPCQWERAIFYPPTAPRPLDRFSWNLKYITTSLTRPRTQNFRGLRRRGWSGQIASLTHESFCPFFPILGHAHRSHFWTHPNAQYVIIRRFRQGSAFWGLERLNLKFDPFTPQKRKNWDFKLAVNGKL